MAMTPEKKVKAKVVKLLKERAVYHFFPATGGYGTSGVPDIVCCYMGRFIGIECKAGKGKTTALQDIQLNKIGDAGGIALVVNEQNMDSITAILNVIKLGNP
jgi:hypothetical protein